MTNRSPFRYFKTSPEIIRLAVMPYVRFALSLRNVEDLLHERGIDVGLPPQKWSTVMFRKTEDWNSPHIWSGCYATKLFGAKTPPGQDS